LDENDGHREADEGHQVTPRDGIPATARIATPRGWLPAAALHPGQEVLTTDAGAVRLRGLSHARGGSLPRLFWPVCLPPLSLGNRAALVLPPDQRVLVEADVAEDLYGDPLALIPARALVGWRGIAQMPPGAVARIDLVRLAFERPQIVYAEGATLLWCPGPAEGAEARATLGYVPFPYGQARHLVACLIAEESGRALRESGLRLVRP
jgi:hypothetical protein